MRLETDKAKFYIPNIKLVGYGRNQSYQCVCLKCNELYFNMTTIKDLQDLFCSWCKSNESFLTEDNLAFQNFVGNIVGWEIKCAEAVKRRNFYNYIKVYKRDQYKCQYCGYSLRKSNEFRPLHIDHIRPWSSAGSNKMENLVVACAPCNLAASDKWFNSFKDKYEFIKEKRGF